MALNAGRRVLLLGLDSADAALIEAWADAGHLPTFDRLRRAGCWSRLVTTAEVMHVSAWPSIYTGRTPGHHGLYHAYQVRAGDQRIHRTLPEWLAQPPFWKLLDDAGRRCIVFDAFMDAPLAGFQGIQVLEYGTWTWFGAPGSSPNRMLKDIVARFGRYPAPEHTEQVTIPEQLWFRDQLVQAAAVKGEATRWLLGQHPWDMAFVTFGEPHGAGHYLWHSDDPGYPLSPPGGRRPGSHLLRDVYAAVDRAIGEILAEIGDDTTVLVCSGDGMGPNYSGAHLVPELLHQLELLVSANVGRRAEVDRPKQGLAQALRGMIPLSVRQSITRCLPRRARHELSMKWMNSGTDWSRTSAFCIPNSNEAYIRLNLEGREPAGIVADGAASSNLVSSLAQELAGLVNPLNGRTCAHRVHVMDETFGGAQRCHLPDISVSWDNDAQVLDRIQAPTAALIEGVPGHAVPAHYTGNHRPTAFVLAAGRGVSSGAEIAQGSILDIAPTILALLDVDPPPQLEGRAWPAVR